MSSTPNDSEERGHPPSSLSELIRLFTGNQAPWADRLSAIGSAIMVVAAGVMQFGTNFTAPQMRWTLAGIVGILCATAVVLPILRPSSYRYNRSLSRLFYAGILLSAAVILLDIMAMGFQRSQPIDCVGCTLRPAKNPKPSERIPKYEPQRVAKFRAQADIVQEVPQHNDAAESLYHDWPAYFDLKVVKRSHESRVVIDDIEVEVVRFWPIGLSPTFAAPAPTSPPVSPELIEIPVVVVPLRDQRPKNTPWTTSATQVVTHPDFARVAPWWQFDRQLRGENDYARFNIVLRPESTGLYDLNIYVIANNQRVLATTRPARMYCFAEIPADEFEYYRKIVERRRKN